MDGQFVLRLAIRPFFGRYFDCRIFALVAGTHILFRIALSTVSMDVLTPTVERNYQVSPRSCAAFQCFACRGGGGSGRPTVVQPFIDLDLDEKTRVLLVTIQARGYQFFRS